MNQAFRRFTKMFILIGQKVEAASSRLNWQDATSTLGSLFIGNRLTGSHAAAHPVVISFGDPLFRHGYRNDRLSGLVGVA